MKKIISLILAVCMLTVVLCACGGKGEGTGTHNGDKFENIDTQGLPALKVGIPKERVPQEELMGTLASRIANKGYALEFVEFDNAQQASTALMNKEIDLSFVSEKADFEAFNKENPDVLLNLGPVYFYPYGVYLCNFETKDSIADGATIAVPDDAVGLARSLMLLEAQGYITLKEGVGLNATLADVEKNERGFKLVAEPADKIALNMQGGKADMAVMSSRSAVDAGYPVNRYAIAIEEIDCIGAIQYSTILLINKDELSSAKYKDVSMLYYSHMMCETVDAYPEDLVVASFSVVGLK